MDPVSNIYEYSCFILKLLAIDLGIASSCLFSVPRLGRTLFVINEVTSFVSILYFEHHAYGIVQGVPSLSYCKSHTGLAGKDGSDGATATCSPVTCVNALAILRPLS